LSPTAPSSIASHIQLFKENARETSSTTSSTATTGLSLSLDSTCSTRFFPPPRSHKIYGTFENSSIALDSSRAARDDDKEGKKGELSDRVLRGEHLTQSGDDIKKSCVYGYAHSSHQSQKVKIVTMKNEQENLVLLVLFFSVEIILFHLEDM
jgi:hypothetical protein